MSSAPSLSIIIPTLGRTSLLNTLAGLAKQISPADEVWVVADDGEAMDHAAGAMQIVHGAAGAWHLACPSANGEAESGCWGNHARQWGVEQAGGDRLVFMDDDDAFMPDALAAIRAAALAERIAALAAGRRERPLIFRMVYRYNNSYLWTVPEVRPAMVGTPMFVPLREPVADWRADCSYTSDFEWIKATIDLQGSPIWREEAICWVRPLERSDPNPEA